MPVVFIQSFQRKSVLIRDSNGIKCSRLFRIYFRFGHYTNIEHLYIQGPVLYTEGETKEN